MGWLLLSLAAFVAAVILQAVPLRLSRVRHGIFAFFAVGVPIGLGLLAVLMLNWPLDRSISGVLLYAFLCEFWMFIMSVTFSSVAAKLMMHLRIRPMTLKEMDGLYDSRVMIQNRIAWLAHIGAAVKYDDRLTATGGGQKLARTFEACRSFFGHH
jgi:hypothetical protein